MLTTLTAPPSPLQLMARKYIKLNSFWLSTGDIWSPIVEKLQLKTFTCQPKLFLFEDLKSKMACALCDELRSAQPPCLDMFYTCTFQILDFDTRVELNIFYTFVLVVLE